MLQVSCISTTETDIVKLKVRSIEVMAVAHLIPFSGRCLAPPQTSRTFMRHRFIPISCTYRDAEQDAMIVLAMQNEFWKHYEAMHMAFVSPTMQVS